MYRHVCTMFSDVRTVLPILVQVVRIPDAGPYPAARSHVGQKGPEKRKLIAEICDPSDLSC